MSELELGIHREITNMYELINPVRVFLSDASWNKVRSCRSYLELRLTENNPIYGVNTGFGSLANTWIENNKLQDLQVNLIRSHAAGLGDEIPESITRTAMILLVNSLAKGYSGIREEVLTLLIEMINKRIHPVSYTMGSLGASGDLATLAHLALALIGEGEVIYEGRKYSSITELSLQPVTLQAKEGLALINGTHFIAAYSLHLSRRVDELIMHTLVGAALSLEATRGTSTAFDDHIASLRLHPGHRYVSTIMSRLLEGSKIIQSHQDMHVDHKVQDPYVFRCIPQVIGAVQDSLEYLNLTLSRELNSVTDNPLIFHEDDLILSGGNFHAEPLALPLETVGMALVEMANMSEMRINRLFHPQTEELPAFLASDPGLESGYMITHYTVAALLNRARVLSHPAVTDNISVSGSQEDHVSMAMGSAQKSTEIADLVEQIIALEIYLAIRGLNMQENRPSSSKLLESIISLVNSNIEFVREDHYVREKMIQIIELVRSGQILALV
ncbi:MAG: histidine ammonia-lyase [Candidatus Heimdallarchaeota archaeon]|nr:histidine ammonia-lyase [Candidatus Heimdallarchaeota archaeon]